MPVIAEIPMFPNTGTVKRRFIAKVYRQHESQVIIVPGAFCIGVCLKPGHHAVFVWMQNEEGFEFMKWKPEGDEDDGDQGNTDRSDQGGRA